MDIDWIAVLLRALAAGGFVGGVIFLMERTSPFIGGVVLTLPIVIAPAYFLLALHQPPAFVQAAAVTSMGTIGAGIGFLTAYIRIIGPGRTALSVIGGTAAWLAAAALVAALPPTPATMLLLAAAMALLGWGLNRRIVDLGTNTPRGRSPLNEVVLRGALAGLLVALVTSLAPLLGPDWTGIAAGYPVALTVVGSFLPRRFDLASTRAAMASSQIGLVNSVAFFLALHGLLPHLPPLAAFAGAVLASIATVLLLITIRRARTAGRTA